MNRKLEWLKRHGGPDAVRTFIKTIEDMDSFAKATNLAFKENETVKNKNFLLEDDEVEVAGDNLLLDEPTTEIEKEVETSEPVLEATEVVTETVVGTVATELPAEFVSYKEFQSVLDELVDNAITPLVKAFEKQVEIANELKGQVAELSKQLEKVVEFQKSVNEPVEDVLSVIPNASAVSYLQSRLTGTMKSFVGISKAEDNLVDRKPVENLYKQNTNNDFDLFLSGQ